MNTLAERLARFRRQAGDADAQLAGRARRAPVGATATRGGAPGLASRAQAPQDLIAQLRHQLGLRNRAAGRFPSTVHADRDLPGDELAPGLRYLEARFEWLSAPAELDAGFAGLDPIARDRVLHFDTETTGLAGGTGTRAFMIGAADWSESGLRLRQLTLTTLAAEGAMLGTFADWLRPDTVLVSYNGKSYDAPLLATRYRLARLDNPLAGLVHLDLLHPVRRRWRGDWPNCRLATAEARLLGVEREDDLPGAEAPRAWLDYLRGDSARNLRRVYEHNAQDLRSLAGILLRLSRP
jgi:uncharacterized protein